VVPLGEQPRSDIEKKKNRKRSKRTLRHRPSCDEGPGRERAGLAARVNSGSGGSLFTIAKRNTHDETGGTHYIIRDLTLSGAAGKLTETAQPNAPEINFQGRFGRVEYYHKSLAQLPKYCGRLVMLNLNP